MRLLVRARLGIVCAGLVMGIVAAPTVSAQEMVDVMVPGSVTFPVVNIGASTSGTPGPTTVSFSNATLVSGHALRISVHADSADFTAPSGPRIAASKVTWTTSGASAGTGSDGTLSAASYGVVFESQSSPTSGSVDVGWTLAPPGAGIRAGDHSLTIRWKFESIVP